MIFIYNRGSNTKREREREIVNKKNFNQSFPPDKSPFFFQTSTVFHRRPCRGSMKFMGTSQMAPWPGGFLRFRDVPRLFCKGYLQPIQWVWKIGKYVKNIQWFSNGVHAMWRIQDFLADLWLYPFESPGLDRLDSSKGVYNMMSPI